MRDHETTDEESETESSVTDTESDVSVGAGDEAVEENQPGLLRAQPSATTSTDKQKQRRLSVGKLNMQKVIRDERRASRRPSRLILPPSFADSGSSLDPQDPTNERLKTT